MSRSVFETVARRGLYAAVLLPFVVSSSLLAASGTAEIAGRVTASDTGRPVAGAIVLVEGSGQSAVTDARGRYRLEGLTPGEHRLVVVHLGGEAAWRSVRTAEATAVRADFELQVLSEQVVVTASGE
jgi:hypothetical protein